MNEDKDTIETSADTEKDIIEISADTEDEGKSGLYPYDPTQADIDIRETPHTIFELMRKYDDKRLIINPEFQRNLVWKPEQKSKFIESVILNFPLPPFYVNETREGKYIVVDGLQRTTALHEFLQDKFQLKGLEALPHLNGKDFSALKNMSGAYQTKIEDKKVLLYVLRPSVPLAVVYDLFNRINTGGTQLERQEVRNCIFLGKATELLKELSEADYFRKAIDNGISPKRMKDREAILRYLAFKLFDYQKDYHGDMSRFVEEAMRKINKMSVAEISALKEDFERVMKCTYEFFGTRNFRVPLTGKPNTRGRINIAVLESVGYFFSVQQDDFLCDHKPAIMANFDRLLKDKDYLDAVQKSTGDKNRVITRFQLAQTILGEVNHAHSN
ncbi:MAG: hypothetical protein BWK78_08160 [Thiotrichaceae bacterium IS1]|nr:MAG: hypothetical protein BWK78_08160 [Thiotrichaceae bacterium IS1]